jgi:hypothetical protein
MKALPDLSGIRKVYLALMAGSEVSEHCGRVAAPDTEFREITFEAFGEYLLDVQDEAPQACRSRRHSS